MMCYNAAAVTAEWYSYVVADSATGWLLLLPWHGRVLLISQRAFSHG
jgi:hypothetical protein